MIKIGVAFGLVLTRIVGIQHWLSEQKIPLLPSSLTLKALPNTKATLVYFEYELDLNHYEDQQINLQLERCTDNQLNLVDDAKAEQGRTYYDALNGTVNPTDTRQLTQKPILPNRWITS